MATVIHLRVDGGALCGAIRFAGWSEPDLLIVKRRVVQDPDKVTCEDCKADHLAAIVRKETCEGCGRPIIGGGVMLIVGGRRTQRCRKCGNVAVSYGAQVA